MSVNDCTKCDEVANNGIADLCPECFEKARNEALTADGIDNLQQRAEGVDMCLWVEDMTLILILDNDSPEGWSFSGPYGCSATLKTARDIIAGEEQRRATEVAWAKLREMVKKGELSDGAAVLLASLITGMKK